MKNKLIVLFALFVSLTCLTGCSSSIEGTWYGVDFDDGEMEIWTFDDDGTDDGAVDAPADTKTVEPPIDTDGTDGDDTTE